MVNIIVFEIDVVIYIYTYISIEYKGTWYIYIFNITIDKL